jgi:hypothetical protein
MKNTLQQKVFLTLKGANGTELSHGVSLIMISKSNFMSE